MNVAACPSCSKQLQYNPQQAGMRVQCPACQAGLILPGAPNPTLPADPLMGAPMQMQPGMHGTQQQSTQSQVQSRPSNAPSSNSKKNIVLWSSVGGAILVLVVILIVVLGDGRDPDNSGEDMASNGESSKAGQPNTTDASLRGGKPIPDDFPKDIPIHSGMVCMQFQKGKKGEFHLRLHTKQTADEVVDWFNAKLGDQGWELKVQFPVEKPSRLRYEKKMGRSCFIQVLGYVLEEEPEVLGAPIKTDETTRQVDIKTELDLLSDPDVRKLHSLVKAVRTYHYENNEFPFVKHVAGEDADSGFSWMVYVLPFIDKRAQFDKFDLTGSYKSPQNAAFGKEMIDELVPGFGQIRWVRGSTVPTSFKTLYEMDGASSTVCLVLSKKIDDGPWTKPTSIKPSEVIEEFKALQDEESMIFGMYDGSVRRITNEYDLSDIEAVLEPADRKLPKNLSR